MTRVVTTPDSGLGTPNYHLAVRSLIFITALFASTLAAAPPIRPPVVVTYKIDVTLDAAKKTLRGRERITWRTPAQQPVPDLQFHLYLNAFRDEQSTFMRESGGQLRQDRFDRSSADSWGSIEVNKIVVSGGRGDVTSRGRFIQPDTPDRGDRTVVQYVLPRAVDPGEVVTIDIDFEAKLPRVFARTGFADDGDFFMVGQWFPKLGVYEPVGMRNRRVAGWNCHQFHANSEFYADFGDYDVSITTPAEFIVGATGRRASEIRNGKAKTHRFVEENVHDFAWTASPKFRVHQLRFDPSRDVPASWRKETARLLGVPDTSLQLKPINVTLLMQPEHDDQTERHKAALFSTIAWTGLRYGPYPYANVTLVDPPESARGAGGMEYPGIFTGMTGTSFNRFPLKGIRYPEVVVVHEYAHEYWYGMVASNEFEEPWLDEGFTSYTESEVMRNAYGDRAYELPVGTSTSTEAWFRAAYVKSDALDPIIRHAWGFSSDSSYGLNSYGKPTLALRQLEGEIGHAQFARALREYFQTWSFRHPTSTDFFAIVQKHTDHDITPTVRSAFYGTDRFDLFVQSAKTRAEGEKQVSDVTIGRRGAMQAGAEVEFRFTNGHVERRRFAPSSRWTKYHFEYGHPLERVVIDPKNENTWDLDLLNNSRLLQSDARAASKLTVRASSLLLKMSQLLWGLL